jgi:multiple antibiotic resistance protein
VLAVLVLVLALVLLGLLLATRMMRLIGVTGANVITRVLGVILGALAVQYVVDGIAGSFGSL